MNTNESVALIDRFRDLRVLVVGDIMLDRYVTGSVSRISPEAPVPVVQVAEETARLGGAANVALNIRALGGQALMAGIVGEDPAAGEVRRLLEAEGIETGGVMSEAELVTTVKTRVLADRQQIVRVDHERPNAIGAGLVQAFCQSLPAVIDAVDAVIIEDYGKGVVCQEVVNTILQTTGGKTCRVGLDPKDNHELLFDWLTLATPNYMEACVAVGEIPRPIGGDPERNDQLVAVGRRLQTKWNSELLIVTLGPHGMYLLPREGEPSVIPTQAREVFDVSGAGDTVIAAAMLALCAGGSRQTSAILANHAAGVVVGKVGTVPCSRDELVASLDPEEPSS